MGVRFLPDALFPCLTEVMGFFRDLAREFEAHQDRSYNPAFSTVNFGQLKQKLGGMELHFDMRLLPDISPDEMEMMITKGIQKISSQYPSLNLSVTRERMNPGLNMTLDHDLVRICQEAMEEAGLLPALDKKATSTEAAQYFGAGYEAVIFGPGLSQGNSHSPNEHNILEHMKKAIAFYEKVIEKVCCT